MGSLKRWWKKNKVFGWGDLKPGSETVDGWRDWEVNTKSKYPFKYWLLEEFPEKYIWPIEFQWNKLNRAKWWVYHRYVPKYKYNTVVCKALEPGYHDPSELILHAPFTVFCDFVDMQLVESTIDWEEKIDVWDEMQRLYNWYMVIRPNREESLSECPTDDAMEAEYGFMWVLSERCKDTPEYAAWSAWAEESREAEAKWQQEDIDMIIRLAKIKDHIWYP